MTSKSSATSKSFLSLEEILEFSSKSTTRQKYVTCSSIKVIAEAYNDSAAENGFKFDLSLKDSDLRNKFFSVFKSIDLGPIYDDYANNDADLVAACQPSKLLTSNGYKCSGLLKSTARGTVSPSTNNIVNTLHNNGSLKDAHGANTIGTHIENGIEVSKRSPPPSGAGSLGASAPHNSTFNVNDTSHTETLAEKINSARIQILNDDGDLSLAEIKDCLNSLITASNDGFDKVKNIEEYVNTAIANQNSLIAKRNTLYDDKIDKCETQVATNTVAIETINANIKKIDDNFNKVQVLLGLQDLDIPNISNEDLANNLQTAVSTAIEDSVNRKIDAAITSNPKINPAIANTPAENFASAVEEVRNRVSVIKNEGGLRVVISNSAKNTYVKVQLTEDTENFDTRALAVLLGANFNVVFRKFSPGQPTIWIRVHKGTSNSPRDAANEILENRDSYAGKVGVSWAVNVIDDITVRLLYLKRRQIISNFKIGKSGFFFIDLNDGDQTLYDALATAVGSDLKTKRNLYIKSCTSIKIEAPQQFKQLSEDIIRDTNKMKAIKEKKAFYWNGEFHEFTQEELKKFSKTGLLNNVTAAMGTRDLKWAN